MDFLHRMLEKSTHIFTYKIYFFTSLRIIITVTIEVPGCEPVTKTTSGFLLLFIVVGIK
jgi:hypothetical protein